MTPGPVNQFVARAKDGRDKISSIGGQQAHYVVDLTDATGAIAIPAGWRNSRAVVCDVDGVVRVGYMGDGGTERIETKDLAKGEKWLLIDVCNVYYQYGTTPANCDAQVYNDDGDLITGIKLIY
jgi:hypothetical protein